MKITIETREDFPQLKRGDILTVLTPNGKWYQVCYVREPSTVKTKNKGYKTREKFKKAVQKVGLIMKSPQVEYWKELYEVTSGMYKRKKYSRLRDYIMAHEMFN